MNKLVDECNNTYHHSFDKQPIDVNYFALAEEIDTSHKAHKIKSGLLGIRIFLAMFIPKISQKKYLWSIKCWKLTPVRIKLKNGETAIGSFYEKELLLGKLKLIYYLEPNSHISYKSKVVLKFY